LKFSLILTKEKVGITVMNVEENKVA